MKNKLTILSYGGGQDSTALLLKYAYDAGFREKYAPDDFLVVMSDTGDEHNYTYNHIEWTKRFCLDHKIEFHHLTPSRGFHTPAWQGLIEWQRRTGNIVMLGIKSCTDKLKIVPIYKFLDLWISKKYNLPYNGRKQSIKAFKEKYNQDINVMIGISRGEEQRVKEKRVATGWKSCVTTIYPLINMGMDRKDCQNYTRSKRVKVPFPSNCMRCPYMSDVELLWLKRNYPAKLMEWIELEEKKLAKFSESGKKNCGVFASEKTIEDRLMKVERKYGHLRGGELNDYKFSHGCVKSKY